MVTSPEPPLKIQRTEKSDSTLSEADTTPFSVDVAQKVRKFFGNQSPPTPLVVATQLSKQLGVAGIYIKDESKRQGQQAFKVNGGTYAMATWLAQKIEVVLSEVNGLPDLRKRYFEKFTDPVTFVTCTDGNHGRAVAFAAKHLGQKAVVYMPKGSAAARVAHIQAHGGDCTVTDLNYDATVAFAFEQAEKNGWILLQDTTGPDYLEIPKWIMQGYTALMDEAIEQMNSIRFTHVVLQVGVGSFAGAVLGYLVEEAKANGKPLPKAICVEPKNAACAFASAKHGDGTMVNVEGDLDTMIAGLACGELSALGWPILARFVKGGYCWIGDHIAGNGMRTLARENVEAGECGGAGMGLVQRLMDPACPKAARLRQSLGLDANSHVLIVNTEGATDLVNYQEQMKLPEAPFVADDFDFAPPLQISQDSRL